MPQCAYCGKVYKSTHKRCKIRATAQHEALVERLNAEAEASRHATQTRDDELGRFRAEWPCLLAYIFELEDRIHSLESDVEHLRSDVRDNTQTMDDIKSTFDD